MKIDEAQTRLRQWIDVVTARLGKIYRAYDKIGMPYKNAILFTVDDKIRVDMSLNSTPTVTYVNSSTRYPLESAFKHPDFDPNWLLKIRGALLVELASLEQQLEERTKKLEEQMGAVLKDFETDLASDAIQNGKLYPPGDDGGNPSDDANAVQFDPKVVLHLVPVSNRPLPGTPNWPMKPTARPTGVTWPTPNNPFITYGPVQ